MGLQHLALLSLLLGSSPAVAEASEEPRLVRATEVTPRRRVPIEPPSGWDGSAVDCLVRLQLDRRGRPTVVDFAPACPESFHEVIRRGVGRWRFQPFEVEGRAEPVRFDVALRFRGSARQPGRVLAEAPAEPPPQATGDRTIELRSRAPFSGYPPFTRRIGSAVCKVDLQVDPNGRPTAAEVDEGCPRALRAPMRRNTLAWTFHPPLQDGEAVRGTYQVIYRHPDRRPPARALRLLGDVTDREGYEPARIEAGRPVPYPRRGEGEVTCGARLLVSAQGRVHAVEVSSACPRAFRRPLRQSVEQWRFRPARLDLMPVPSEHEIEVTFRPPQD